MKIKIIAQVLYFFKENKLISKKFLRTVDKETSKTYQVWATEETFKKSEENKPVLLYGNTISLWKIREIEEEEKHSMPYLDYENIRHEMVAELKADMKKYLLERVNNL